MAVYELTIPAFRIQKDEVSWGHEYFVQKRQANGR